MTSLEDRKQAQADEVIRNEVEGKFGQGKRRYSLGRVMTKLSSASTAQISLTFLVTNLDLALRRLLAYLFYASLDCRVLLTLSRDRLFHQKAFPDLTYRFDLPLADQT